MHIKYRQTANTESLLFDQHTVSYSEALHDIFGWNEQSIVLLSSKILQDKYLIQVIFVWNISADNFSRFVHSKYCVTQQNIFFPKAIK